MKFKIIAVGGTGQMVLHYYLQLYLLGVVKDPIDAVVVDSDDIIPTIRTIQGFFENLQYGSEGNEGFGKIRIPVIETVAVRPPGKDTAFEALTALRDWDKKRPHPAHAFFDKETLAQNVKQGLFARPALSSVAAPGLLSNAALKPESDSVVVIVGCVIGGTGGGLIAPVLDTIRQFIVRENIERVRIRAVLFGEYFKPTQGIIEDGVLRFQSNQMLVLRSIREAKMAEQLHKFIIVGGPGFPNRIDRDPQREKDGKNLPWPVEESHPLWQGARAVEQLLHDSTTDVKLDFEDREIEEPTSPFDLPRAKLRLRNGLQMAETFVGKKGVVRMCRDPWSRWIWGERLVEMVAHFWSIAAKVAGGKERNSNFPAVLQSQLEDVWHGENEGLGLHDIFPSVTESHRIRPRNVGKVRWAEVTTGAWERNLFTDSKMAALRAASNLLFWMLREGV